MIFQEIAKRFGGVFIFADSGLRLREKKFDGGLGAVRLRERESRFLERVVELLLMVESFGERVVSVPACGIELSGLLQRSNGEVVAAFVDESHAERGKGLRIFGVDLCGFFENGLRFVRLIAAKENDALKIKNIGMIGREPGGLIEKFFGLIEFVVVECLQGFVESFFCFGSENGARGGSKRFGRRIALEDNLLFGFHGDGDGDFLLRGAVADGVGSDGVVAEAIQDEDGAAFGGSHLAGERAEIVELHRDQRSNELAGTFLDGYRDFRAIAAETAFVRGAFLGEGGDGCNEEEEGEYAKNLKVREKELRF